MARPDEPKQKDLIEKRMIRDLADRFESGDTDVRGLNNASRERIQKAKDLVKKRRSVGEAADLMDKLKKMGLSPELEGEENKNILKGIINKKKRR